MRVIETTLAGVRLLEPTVFRDDRGLFLETWRADRFAAAGIPDLFVQDNYSRSSRGHAARAALAVAEAAGEAGACRHRIDLRRRRRRPARITDVRAVARRSRCRPTTFTQLYVPVGFAHGFCVTSDVADVEYKCSEVYDPQGEAGLIWNDPGVGVDWPIKAPLVSAKDAAYGRLSPSRPDLL